MPWAFTPRRPPVYADMGGAARVVDLSSMVARWAVVTSWISVVGIDTKGPSNMIPFMCNLDFAPRLDVLKLVLASLRCSVLRHSAPPEWFPSVDPRRAGALGGA